MKLPLQGRIRIRSWSKIHIFLYGSEDRIHLKIKWIRNPDLEGGMQREMIKILFLGLRYELDAAQSEPPSCSSQKAYCVGLLEVNRSRQDLTFLFLL